MLFLLRDWVRINQTEYQLPRAQLEINATDDLGRILDVRIVDGGEGYDDGLFPRNFNDPRILVTGGGGMEADLRPVINNGRITDVLIMNSGRGYFNLNNELQMSLAVMNPHYPHRMKMQMLPQYLGIS